MLHQILSLLFLFLGCDAPKKFFEIQGKTMGTSYSVKIGIKQKDINDMVLSGIKDIQKLIDENTFRGLEAKVRFKDWRKINAQ